MVDFCEKCGALIMGKKGEDTACPACGTVKKAKGIEGLSQKVEQKEIEVVDADSSSEIHPIIDNECPECKHSKAFYWSKQMRAGDEPETLFYKCEKCKHQWRDYR